MALVFAPQPKNPAYPCSASPRSDGIGAYLETRNFLAHDERVMRVIAAARASRNSTCRVETTGRTFVVKCFAPWPENGRATPAPGDRFQAEHQFYRTIRIAEGMAVATPALLHHDCHAGCLILEDAGRPQGRAPLSVEDAANLAWILVGMHHHSQSVPEAARYRNESVLGWQMAHLFQRCARPEHGREGRWLARFTALGEGPRHAIEDAQAALGHPGTALVHGDFTLSNWVRDRKGVLRVVDAEFSTFGPPEFDVGSFLASLLATRQEPAAVRAALAVVGKGCFRYRLRLAAAFTAVHLCALLDVGSRGSSAENLIRRVAAAVTAGSLEGLA